jgi:hypothetical protein
MTQRVAITIIKTLKYLLNCEHFIFFADIYLLLNLNLEKSHQAEITAWSPLIVVMNFFTFKIIKS